jgi:hypothetical protein
MWRPTIIIVLQKCDKVMDSSNPTHGEVYLMQHYVVKCISALRQVSGFLWEFRFPLPIKLTALV